jgi:hypothetical protein
MARKPKPASGKRYPLNMRTTRELRERIIAAAHTSGRSLVQEVEYRLERSFEKEDQQKLAEQAATTALQRAGFPFVPFGASARDQSPAKSADETLIAAGDLRIVGKPRRDKDTAEPPTPAVTGEKDKAS